MPWKRAVACSAGFLMQCTVQHTTCSVCSLGCCHNPPPHMIYMASIYNIYIYICLAGCQVKIAPLNIEQIERRSWGCEFTLHGKRNPLEWGWLCCAGLRCPLWPSLKSTLSALCCSLAHNIREISQYIQVCTGHFAGTIKGEVFRYGTDFVVF